MCSAPRRKLGVFVVQLVQGEVRVHFVMKSCKTVGKTSQGYDAAARKDTLPAVTQDRP